MRTIQTTAEEATRIGSDPEEGLSGPGVEASRREHGDNRLPEIKGRSVASMFKDAFADKTIIVLMGAALVALGVELGMSRLDETYEPHYIDGIAIWAAVLIATVVTVLNEARAAKEFRSLAKVREDIPIKVLRSGHVRNVSIYELVVGDVCYLEAGDRVPADGLLLTGVDLAVDQSMLTGESDHVRKGDTDPKLPSGAIVTNGSGSMLVTAVGEKTEMGQLQARLAEDERTETPLQERLAKLADKIGVFGLFAAILTFIALTASAHLTGQLQVEPLLALARQLLGYMIIGVTIVVVAVPEGLPVAVTISLAYSVRKMARDKSLVRHLASCETMGAATVICSDKTGTLTQNQMTVNRLWFAGEGLEARETPEDVRGPISRVASINATAFLETAEDGQTRYVGNPTECALLQLALGWGVDWRALRKSADVVHQFGFSSDRKRMSTVVRRSEGGFEVLLKGAPEVVLERTTRVFDSDGPRPLDDQDRRRIEDAVESSSRSGRRTLALAVREMAEEPESDDASEYESDLTLVAVVGISDPVRPEVASAVEAARKAGVDVKMVTGDNRQIAESIARELQMVAEGDVVMDGDEFRALSDSEMKPKLSTLRVLARSVPSDKHRLVSLLQEAGEVVAVTGDGTNDAPALKKADVGFAMGLSGTEVAKEASDIVILDDNFASIVRAIRWGRSIFENIRKFLQFQLTVNVAALVTAFLAAVFGFGVPLNTVQLLWVNLIMDALAALALAVEPPSAQLLEQPPHGRHAPLITKSMWVSILATSVYMVTLLMLSMWTSWVVPADVPHEHRLTFVFNAFVMMQLFNEVNARSTRFDRSAFQGILQSHLFLGVMLVTLVLQVAIVQFGGAFFKTVPIGPDLWLRSIGLGASVLVFGAVLRLIGRQLPVDWSESPRRLAPL